MATLKVIGICGSLRKMSTNLGLLRYAQEHAPEGMEIKIAELDEVPFLIHTCWEKNYFRAGETLVALGVSHRS